MDGATKRDELTIAGLLFLFFFLVIAVFQILKPLKSGLFVSHFGANMELYAKLSIIVLAAVGVMLYSLLYTRLGRRRLIYALSAFFAVWFIALSGAMERPNAATIWTFYILGDLEATVMVAAFWAYLTDISTPSQGKRLFGLIGAGGVLGGWAGVSMAKLLLAQIGSQGLLLVAAVLMGLVILLVHVTEQRIRATKAFRQGAHLRVVPKSQERHQASSTELVEGARLVMRSRYLLAIAGLLVAYEFASQLIDYRFKLAAEGLSGDLATQAFLVDVGFYASSLAVVVQLFLVGTLMKRFGVGVTLLVLPLAIIVGSIGFLLVPAIMAASLLSIFDNGLNYSIQQTGRESLYLVVTPEEKYKARAFIQMFVQRLAKGVSVLAVIALGAVGGSATVLTGLTMVVMGVMAALGLYAGRSFAEASADTPLLQGAVEPMAAEPTMPAAPLVANG